MLAGKAALIAGFIRILVRVLRSPLIAPYTWDKIPVAARPFALLGVGAAAAALDYVAAGTPPLQAIFSAFGGVMGAIASHEVGERVLAKNALEKFSAAPSAEKK